MAGSGDESDGPYRSFGGIDRPADYLIPDAVKTFVVKFWKLVTAGRVYDVAEAYEREWREVSKKFFEDTTWPAVGEIAALVEGDEVFLSLYNLLYHRHIFFTLTRGSEPATLSQYADSWDAFIEFFELITDPERIEDVVLPPVLIHDITSDFLDHFSRFHADHRQVDVRAGPSPDEDDEDDERAAFADCWQVDRVLRTFYGLVEGSGIEDVIAAKETPSTVPHLAAYFSLVNLCRFHAKLGDYHEALYVIKDIDLLAEGGLLSRVTKCHVTLAYYASFALIMSRRYAEALTLISRILLNLQRTRHSLFSDPSGHSQSMIKKKAEQMLSLLAICHLLCPGQRIDDLVMKVLNEKYSDHFARVAAGSGDSDFDFLFGHASYKYIDPTANEHSDPKVVYQRHLSLFKRNVEARMRMLPAVRGYLQLYTNIDLPKLAEFCGVESDEMRQHLVSLKLTGWHRASKLELAEAAEREGESGAAAGAAGAGAASDSPKPASASASVVPEGWISSDSLHFFVNNNVVTVEEHEVEQQSGEFFVRLIGNFNKVVDKLERAR